MRGSRLFVALDLTDEARDSIARLRDRVCEGRSELRPVPDAKLHVTLLFLGDLSGADGDRVAEQLGQATGSRPELVPRAVVGVPLRSPRLLALDLEDVDGRGALLRDRLLAALPDLDVPERDRPLWPHVTLARVRGRGAATSSQPRLESTGGFMPEAVVLLRSVRTRQGSRYEDIARMAL